MGASYKKVVLKDKDNSTILLPRTDSGLVLYDESTVDKALDCIKTDKQDTLTAGDGIAIDNNVISCSVDTTLVKIVKELPDLPAEGDENKIFAILEYVDLGLSTKWASCNIGATLPEDFGNFYAWGNTRVEDHFDEDNCDTWEVNIYEISGDSKYDTATVNWGSSWRMPTYTELLELVENCTHEITYYNGVHGCLFTSKINGNTIFFPRAGYWFGGAYANGTACYWTASAPDDGVGHFAYYLLFNNDIFNSTSNIERWYGYSVRAVSDSTESGEHGLYIWVDGEWISLGTTDLSNYLTKSLADEFYASKNAVSSILTIAEEALTLANSAYTIAESAYSWANSAYDQANSAYSRASNAYNQANSAYSRANTANTNANSANTTAKNAYNMANDAYNLANSALSSITVSVNSSLANLIIWRGNSSAYNSLSSYDSNTLYLVTS